MNKEARQIAWLSRNWGGDGTLLGLVEAVRTKTYEEAWRASQANAFGSVAVEMAQALQRWAGLKGKDDLTHAVNEFNAWLAQKLEEARP